ncbi:MAG: inositol monophosphatase family protein [Micavibrio sp.]|nr:inositol monophosphatase family protein [Micavibrio sp.]
MVVNARRSANLNVMVEAAEKAGRKLIRDFGEVENLQVSRKGPGDFVSNADLNAEKTIVEMLLKARPNYGFLLEEGGEKPGEDKTFRWIIDPLDGTTNFLHGIPHWCISIALEKDKEIIAGVVYDPIKDEMFYAEKGTGAFVTSKRLRVSARTDLSQSLVAIGGARFGNKHFETFTRELEAVTPHVSATRRFGAAALDLCYVAAGRYDGFWERELNAWDVAAGSLIVKEAGGKVTDMDGGKDFIYGRSIVVGNPAIQGALLKKLQATSDSKNDKVKSAS